MLLVNQIVGFFNQSQDSKTDCISQRNSWNKQIFGVAVQQFFQECLLRLFWFLAQVDDSNIEKPTKPFF